MILEESPTARALLTLEAIQAAPGITAARLAARFGVTDRAARRYVGMLREAGIPVESSTGRYGGYRLGRGARIPPLAFTSAEALGLVMAVLQGWHGSVGSEHPAASALAKILRVLPASTAAPAEAVRQVQAKNPGDAAAMPDPDVTAAIAGACHVGRRVELDYRGSTRIVLDPWAVVVRHGRWYVIGVLSEGSAAGARRVLRLDRITGVDVTDVPCERPAGLDAIREVEDHLMDGWTHQVEIVIEASIEDLGASVPRALGRLEAAGEDRCVLRGTTDAPDWYAQQLASIPAPFTVVGPDAVRDEVRALAGRLSRAVGAGMMSR